MAATTRPQSIDLAFEPGELVVVAGDGTDAALAPARAADPGLRVSTLRSAFECDTADADPADTVVLAGALRELSDAEATALLRRASGVGARRILVLDETGDGTGDGRRTLDELRAVVAAAGLVVEREQTAGRGEPVLHLART